MATILRFDRMQTARARRGPAPRGPATILPFIGVRREGLPPAPEPRGGSAKGKEPPVTRS